MACGTSLLAQINSQVPGSEFRIPSSPQSPASHAQDLDAPRSTLHAPRVEGERRQLTVMFIDVVGSTALSTQLDPEDFRAVIQAYRETCATVIRRFEGYLAKYIGDGLLVYFGYPVAHEDDAPRAVRAGLEIVAALQTLSTPSSFQGEGRGEGEKDQHFQTPPHPNLLPQGEKELRRLQVRLGIHTGLVVAGELGTEDHPEPLAIVGETPNIAARLQERAQPNSVVISAATAHLITGLFELQDLGPQTLKGIATPLSVYQVVRESGAQSRFEAAIRTGLTPLIGRAHEVGLLQERWARAKQGEGQVVLLSGEAGIGKSRLVQELKEHTSREGATCLTFRCSPYHQNSAFYPIIEHMQRLLRFAREDGPEDKLRKLEHALTRRGEVTSPLPTETLVLFASLLSLPHPNGVPSLTLSPQKQKQKTQEALVAWLVEAAECTAVYCVWEDLHWADPSTVEVLHLLLAQVPTARMLTVLTFRPEFTPPWGARSHITQLTLGRLANEQVEEMVAKVTGSKIFPTEVLQQIIRKTDGVPLFVEELTKAAMESVGARHAVPLQALGIPPTLHDALMARLDRMGAAKEIAQVGATLGREFSYEMLHAVSPLREAVLQHALAQLVEAEVLYQRGVGQQAHYLFKHALIQDAAYQSLLKSTRQHYHRQIAQVLEEQFPESKETQPELLAHHYTEAGLIEQAIPYWQQAGIKAAERSANTETVSYVRRGLVLLQTLPISDEHVQQELSLQMSLGLALMATKGYAAPEVAEVQARLQVLCQQVGETPLLFQALPQLRGFYFARGELHAARTTAEQYWAFAQRFPVPVLLVWASYGLGETLLLSGEIASSRSYLEQGIAAYNSQEVRAFSVRTVQDPGVASLSQLASALWYLGYPDQAIERQRQALTLARELAHPFSIVWTLGTTAVLYFLRREGHSVQQQAQAVIQLAQEQGFPFWIARAKAVDGWVLAQQRRGTEGITQICHSMAACRDMGMELYRPHFLILLAEAHAQAEQTTEGLKALAEALEAINKTGARLFETEVYRLKGELLLAQEGKSQKAKGKSQKAENTDPRPLTPNLQGEAEACFLKAINIAQKQQAKSLELRATTSLARLWQQQGKQAEARQMLADVYSWFTEGFDTKDLQEAKALLEELT